MHWTNCVILVHADVKVNCNFSSFVLEPTGIMWGERDATKQSQSVTSVAQLEGTHTHTFSHIYCCTNEEYCISYI